VPDRSTHFSDRLVASVLSRHSVVCVGLDPDLELMPPRFVADVIAGRAFGSSAEESGDAAAAACCAEYCRLIIAAVAETAAVVKPQAAFFEQYGAAGWAALAEVVAAAHEHELPVILDCKRGDIASTARAYAASLFGGAPLPGGAVSEGLGADAATVNPYLGADSLAPFLEHCRSGKGLFVLARTSNPGAADLQERRIDGRPLYLATAAMVARLGDESVGRRGYSDVGAVVGATAPEALLEVRAALPSAFLLVPGVGAQGGDIERLREAAAGDAGGFVVNSSRSILYAWRDRGGDPAAAARDACEELRGRLVGVL